MESRTPSPSVSGSCGSVPARYSAVLAHPSPSESTVSSAGSRGSRPLSASQPSGRPPPSVSGSRGSVASRNSSA